MPSKKRSKGKNARRKAADGPKKLEGKKNQEAANSSKECPILDAAAEK